MSADEIFARADGLLERIAALRGDAVEAASLQAARLAPPLAETVEIDAAPREREACAAEIALLSALPALAAETVSVLDEAKPIYLFSAPEAPDEPRAGLFARVFGGKRTPVEAEAEADVPPSPQEAQAAFAGREARLAALFDTVDEISAALPARREFLEETVFRLQEMAVNLSSGEASSPREIFAVEELASELAGHSDALALHGRMLASIDRTPCGVEDDVAAAAEAHMDGLVEDAA